jgi:DNA repair protein RadA/Sms
VPSRTVFTCQNCDYQAAKWLGRCPECGRWGTLVEELPRSPHSVARPAPDASTPVPYPRVPVDQSPRIATGLSELDRVLGGGLVAGGVTLIGGEPGIGKSTLLLQAASALAEGGRKVLYVTGEESARQLRLRGDRLGVCSSDLLVLAETDVDSIVEAARKARASIVVVDSIQAVRCRQLDSVPGSVGQVREAAGRLVELAKGTGVPVLMIGHVTKEGFLAGPRALEHVVDTVLQFDGDRHHAHRILRALKNRFGPSDELGVFTMAGNGLREVPNPSEFFLAERPSDAPGSAVLAALEGTRPLLAEVQVLVGETVHGSPRRTALGVDPNRVAMVLAVLHRRGGIDLSSRDVFVNVTGGLTVVEPAADLAVAAAAASSAVRRPLPAGCVVMGEIGLTGEIRGISRCEARLGEALRMGFRTAIGPARAVPQAPDGIEFRPLRHLRDALEKLLPGDGTRSGEAT